MGGTRISAVSDDLINSMQKMRNERYGVETIAEKCGVTTYTVCKYTKPLARSDGKRQYGKTERRA